MHTFICVFILRCAMGRKERILSQLKIQNVKKIMLNRNSYFLAFDVFALIEMCCK